MYTGWVELVFQKVSEGVLELKSDFSISTITKEECKPILLKYHYLKNISKGFKSGYNYGLFKHNELVGVIIFTNLPVAELCIGMLGLSKSEQDGLFELSRLCLHPEVQSGEHNLASWFVAKGIKLLRKSTEVRLILSYADADYHNGTVYAACNFQYYGLTSPKKDFYRNINGEYVKQQRGKVKGVDGEWRARSRKHRFLLIYDKSLNVKWKREKWS